MKKARTVRSEEANAHLERMGIKSELNRNAFSNLGLLGMAFSVVNTWPAIGTTISASLPSGGPSSATWGLVVAGIFNMCCGLSLCEFLSAYPTAGGQYHWAAVASWKPTKRAISYITGWINLAAWVCTAAANCLLVSGIITSYISLMHPTYEPKPWHQFLLYVGVNLIGLFFNLFANRFLARLNKYNIYFTLAGFTMSLITILACASPNYQSGAFVYGGFINKSGWSDGWAWQLGLLQGAFSITGFDATMHMMEEIPKPATKGPKLIISAIAMAIATGFCYISAVLFVIRDIPAAVQSSEPLLTIYYQSTGSKAGSICLMMFPILSFVLCTIDDMATSARLSYALARDGGMPFSDYFTRIHRVLGVPVFGLLWCSFWDIVFALIFLGSSDAFNAIISAAVICVTVTYAIPPTINMLRGRRMLPEDRPFRLPTVVGWICNIADLAWTLLVIVLFAFPTQNPTNSVNMNYTVVAFGVVLLISGSNWIFSARKNYKLPTLELADGPGTRILDLDQALEVETNDLKRQGGDSPKEEYSEEKID